MEKNGEVINFVCRRVWGFCGEVCSSSSSSSSSRLRFSAVLRVLACWGRGAALALLLHAEHAEPVRLRCGFVMVQRVESWLNVLKKLQSFGLGGKAFILCPREPIYLRLAFFPVQQVEPKLDEEMNSQRFEAFRTRCRICPGCAPR